MGWVMTIEKTTALIFNYIFCSLAKQNIGIVSMATS